MAWVNAIIQGILTGGLYACSRAACRSCSGS